MNLSGRDAAHVYNLFNAVQPRFNTCAQTIDRTVQSPERTGAGAP